MEGWTCMILIAEGSYASLWHERYIFPGPVFLSSSWSNKLHGFPSFINSIGCARSSLNYFLPCLVPVLFIYKLVISLLAAAVAADISITCVKFRQGRRKRGRNNYVNAISTNTLKKKRQK